MFAGSRREVEPTRPHARRPRRTRSPHDLFQNRPRVRHAGDDRRDPDADVDAGFAQRAHRLEALLRVRRAGLELTPLLLLERGDRDVDANFHTACRPRQHVEIAHDQRPARDDVERREELAQRLDRAARQAIPRLGRLVGIGGGADRDGFALPRLARELRAQLRDEVRLHAHDGAVARIAAGRRGARSHARSRTRSGANIRCRD